MKYTIVMGSPRPDGNTAALLKPFLEASEALGIELNYITLYDKNILPCLGCKGCQDKPGELGCVRQDDFEEIYQAIQDSDLVVLATPIYAWFCTAPMKALLDRLIYACGKYYGAERHGSLLTGKRLTSFATCGYPVEKGTDLWGAALLRLCKHCGMDYYGMYNHRDTGNPDEFMSEQLDKDVRAYAQAMYRTIQREEGA